MKLAFRQFSGEHDWGWVQLHLPGLKRVEDTTGIMAVDTETNQTVAGVIMDTWTHNSVCVHQILTNPMVLRHGFFEEVADYVYNHAGRDVMVGMVPADNERALRLDKAIGFVERGRLPDVYAKGVDVVMLTMTKEQCRFWSAREEVDPFAAEAAE